LTSSEKFFEPIENFTKGKKVFLLKIIWATKTQMANFKKECTKLIKIIIKDTQTF
jgi:hypothetical protein